MTEHTPTQGKYSKAYTHGIHLQYKMSPDVYR